MFDFSLAGPLSGFFVALILLFLGLEQTTSMDLAEQAQLPALPIGLLRTSALGGGLVEWFLGSGTLDAPGESVLPLHPFAVAGFVGIISNALALLPIGRE